MNICLLIVFPKHELTPAVSSQEFSQITITFALHWQTPISDSPVGAWAVHPELHEALSTSEKKNGAKIGEGLHMGLKL
jgi:hypothetical protein